MGPNSGACGRFSHAMSPISCAMVRYGPMRFPLDCEARFIRSRLYGVGGVGRGEGGGGRAIVCY